MKRIWVFSMLLLAGVLTGLPARAAFTNGLIDIDFKALSGSKPVFTGAAVLGAPGDLWNAFPGPSAASAPLFLSNGAASDATLTYSSTQLNSTGPSVSGPYVNLLGDGISSANNFPPSFIGIRGLQPGMAYELIVYAPFVHVVAVNQGGMSGGLTADLFATDAELSFLTEGKDYAVFPVVADGVGGVDLLYTGTANQGFGTISGLQLLAVGGGNGVPLPSAALAGLTAIPAVVVAARRCKRATRRRSV